jgi:superfamily II DNA or RNA helicase
MLSSFQAKYFAYELTRQRPSDDLGKLTASLQDAQVDLNPHQVDAALFAFKSPLSKGAILADEVGLGKTIEAGIILSQKWAERKRKLLVICPANLRKQWSQELTDKFFLQAAILETKSFNETLKAGNLNPFDREEEIVICSYQFIKSKDVYVKQIKWDLVVIDEAHRLRNVYKPGNKIANAIKETVAHAPKILLTATPLQNSLLELFGLVSIIDEYAFGDLKSYKSQFTRVNEEVMFDELRLRLAPVCKRTLRRQVTEYISYTNRISIVEDFYPYDDEKKLYDLVSGYLHKPKLYALPASQRHLMTLILRKLLSSSTYAISGTLFGLKNKLDRLLDDQKQFGYDTPFEEEIKKNYDDYDDLKEEWAEEEEDMENEPNVEEVPLTPRQIEKVKSEISELQSFYELAKKISKNSKGEKLITALRKGFDKLAEIGAHQKAIIFTESTRTQTYIKTILESAGYGGKIVLFNGSNADPQSNAIHKQWLERHADSDRITGSPTADKRQAIVDYFRDEATIMIATEAAAEGINLQFCSLVVNYDLPWNPQRIEQRIGRCHRYGQKFDVVVVNFLNRQNEADVRVFQLLDEKFRLFSGVFGASDEVLGAIGSGVDFEKRIGRIYQECRREEEIKQAFDQLQMELNPQIEENIEQTKRKLLENFDEEVHQRLKINMAEGKEYLSRYEQMLWSVTRYALSDAAEFNTDENSFILKRNPFPGKNIHNGPYFLIKAGGERRKSEIQVPDDVNIFRIGHPLAQAVIRQCKQSAPQEGNILIDLTGSGKKVSALDPYIGKTGLLKVELFSLRSFELEEYLLISAVSENGEIIPGDIAAKMFDLTQDARKDNAEDPLHINPAKAVIIILTVTQLGHALIQKGIYEFTEWKKTILGHITETTGKEAADVIEKNFLDDIWRGKIPSFIEQTRPRMFEFAEMMEKKTQNEDETELRRARGEVTKSAPDVMKSDVSQQVKNRLPVFELMEILQSQLLTEEQLCLDKAQTRNAGYYNIEIDKLDKWADDMKLSLEKEIRDMEAQIKLWKADSRRTVDLTAKVKLQRDIKELEKKRNEKRRSLYEAQDQIDEKKDELLNEIEARLQQDIKKEILFTIQWELI